MASIHSILIPSAQWRRIKEIRSRGRISESNEVNSGVISNHGNGNVAHWTTPSGSVSPVESHWH